MPSLKTTDSIEIEAPAQRVFDTVLDYARMHTWYPAYRCTPIVSAVGAAGATRFQHTVVAPIVRVTSRFTRTIRQVDAPHRIEETYDDGDLVGEGVWTFEESADGWTSAAFHCDVRSNTFVTHVGFALAGELGHKLVYRGLLAGLKIHCEL